MPRCDWCGSEFDDGGFGDDAELVTCSIMCWLELLNFAITHCGQPPLNRTRRGGDQG